MIDEPVEQTPNLPLDEPEAGPEAGDPIEALLHEERRRRRRQLRIDPRLGATVLLVAFVLGLGSGYLAWGNAPAAQSQRVEKLRATLAKQVNPDSGFSLPVVYGNVGPELLAAGGIDEAAFIKLYEQNGKPLTEDQRKILSEAVDGRVKIDKANSYFLLNFFWALGLVNKNPILETGQMMAGGREQVGNFASTGGWTLGTKPATELYSSVEIIKLTPEQQARLEEVASGAYRPCCGNSTSFPDCNHGMALLGLLELMAAQDATVDAMFLAAKQVNAFWFPDQMLEIATYFKTVEGKNFDAVDGRRAVSAQFFSGNGFRQTHLALTEKGVLPAAPSSGQSCGV